ncbi:LD-carboxypeptidase (plasmid) [Peribacillus psychrosaccharolyticus]|uniref:LD-carboxypeptidase n=1 Tax=Peribacillus psychrosaccharolyticus TaxID=1407 RepID=A0A974RYG5_PERPY|nr:S66 peptidase family protein [Peribacillus psychrosaccharolyticus]MEC2054225.1 LD-carboxypeptidase [Peribacillus psychrosaccharolyticus]MED3746576.1 LD-carboxypeptidase [Peribacillus psychrosaccharolyticus]QQS98418.1 LD-carboxypeptidase [Peribacillus psychrosaccharolyticus]
MKKIKLPPPLKNGDQIALFSPSSAGQIKFPKQYEYGKKAIRDLGYTIFEPDNNNDDDLTYRTTSPLKRAEQLHDMFKNPNINGIICNIGGFNTIEMLPFLNFDLIETNPKFICGYSDSSVLLNAIFYKTGVITFHGPMIISSFGEYPKPFDFTVNHFQAMSQQIIELPHHFTHPKEWTDDFIDWTGPDWGTRTRTMTNNNGPIWFHKCESINEGKLVGGNTDSLLHILNTEYFEIEMNSILFIEDIAVSIEKWAMMIWSLKLKGVFNKINGLLIGKIEGMPNNKLLQMKLIISEILELEGISIPVVANLDIGHTAPMNTLLIGSTVSIDSAKENIMIKKLY